ncbi:MAG: hypothetical protein HP496_03660 [Nitrospira sp.]|nr:hypothetical protein [Nitrospira sp.]
MSVRTSPPLAFCFTGLGWLVLASILGLAILIGLVRGTPLPPWVKMLHVHAVLVGGVGQIILGGLLLLIAPPSSGNRTGENSHPIAFWAMNSGVVGMLVGFWLHRYDVVAVTGLVVMAACCSVIYTLWSRARRMWASSMNQAWYYALSLLSLVGGSICGEMLALGVIPESAGYVRLAHIHLVVLGFVVLAIIGMMHHILPTVWNRSFLSPKLAQTAMVMMPLGMAVLIGGFLNSSVPVEMAAGAILFTGGILWAGNLVGTWRSSAHTGSAASDHLLVSTFFLLFTIILGVFIGVNNLSSPPKLPYGTLHLVAYTHMTFIGFIVNAIMGACTYVLPIAIATDRVPNTKKREPYRDQLNMIMNRWSTLQAATLSLGTMGLGLLAALTWNVPLTSLYIQVATWTWFSFQSS